MSFRKTVFRNGLTLVTERHRQYRTLSIGVWVKIGTRHETVKEAGVSHFLEHMLFKGTDRRSALDIARAVDRVGGEFNAFTAREYTCFHITLLDRDVDLAVDILGDVILNSRFDPDELERERKVILQEISMVEESPEELAHDLFFEVVLGKHPLGRPILGTERSIRRMSRADLVKFFRANYRPDQLIVSVSGDVSHAHVSRRLKRMLSRSWPGRPAKKPRVALEEGGRPALKTGTWWLVRPTEQAHVIWGVPGLRYSDRDRFAAYLLNIYLGGGMSSSLFQEIREKNGLAYTVYSNLSAFRDAGMFSIYAATSASQLPLCVRLIEECVRKLQKERLPDEELKIVKENLKGTILLTSDSVEARMMSIAKNEIFFGRHTGADEVCRMIDAVTPDDIRRVARRLLSKREASMLVVGPKPSKAVRARLKPRILKR